MNREAVAVLEVHGPEAAENYDGVLLVLSTVFLIRSVVAENDCATVLLIGVSAVAAGAFRAAMTEFLTIRAADNEHIGALPAPAASDVISRLCAAAVSAFWYAGAAAVPLLAAAAFVRDYRGRLAVVAVVGSLVLLGLGGLGGIQRGASAATVSALKLVIGGWMATGVTVGLSKLTAPAAVLSPGF